MGLWSTLKSYVRMSLTKKDLVKHETAKYRPSVGLMPLWGAGTYQWGSFSLAFVDEMRQDSQVRLCLAYKQTPLYAAEFDVQSVDPRVTQFVRETLDRFWRKSLHYALESYSYGYMPGEFLYHEDNGLIRFDCIKPIHPRDAKPWTVDGKLAFVRVNRIQDEAYVDLEAAQNNMPAKGFWLTHDPTYNPYYGRSALSSAWWPWRLKTMPDGAMESLFKWAYKHSISCMVIRHPDTTYDVDENRTVQAQDIARQMGEQVKAGGVIAMSSATDAAGKYLWDIQQWAKIEGRADGLTDYIDILDRQIQRGILIPDDVLMAGQGGGGSYAKSQVTTTTFFMAAEQSLNHVTEYIDDQMIKPLVRINYGERAHYTIKPMPLRSPEQLNAPQPGVSGMPGQDGGPGQPGVPPAPPGGPQGPPMDPSALQGSGGEVPGFTDDELNNLQQLSLGGKVQLAQQFGDPGGRRLFKNKLTGKEETATDPGARSGTKGEWTPVGGPEQDAPPPKPSDPGPQPATSAPQPTPPIADPGAAFKKQHPQRVPHEQAILGLSPDKMMAYSSLIHTHGAANVHSYKRANGDMVVAVHDPRTGQYDKAKSGIIKAQHFTGQQQPQQPGVTPANEIPPPSGKKFMTGEPAKPEQVGADQPQQDQPKLREGAPAIAHIGGKAQVSKVADEASVRKSMEKAHNDYLQSGNEKHLKIMDAGETWLHHKGAVPSQHTSESAQAARPQPQQPAKSPVPATPNAGVPKAALKPHVSDTAQNRLNTEAMIKESIRQNIANAAKVPPAQPPGMTKEEEDKLKNVYGIDPIKIGYKPQTEQAQTPQPAQAEATPASEIADVLPVGQPQAAAPKLIAPQEAELTEKDILPVAQPTTHGTVGAPYAMPVSAGPKTSAASAAQRNIDAARQHAASTPPAPIPTKPFKTGWLGRKPSGGEPGFADETHKALQSGQSMKGRSVPEQFAEKAYHRGYKDKSSIEKALLAARNVQNRGLGKGPKAQQAYKDAFEKLFPAKQAVEWRDLKPGEEQPQVAQPAAGVKHAGNEPGNKGAALPEHFENTWQQKNFIAGRDKTTGKVSIHPNASERDVTRLRDHAMRQYDQTNDKKWLEALRATHEWLGERQAKKRSEAPTADEIKLPATEDQIKIKAPSEQVGGKSPTKFITGIPVKTGEHQPSKTNEGLPPTTPHVEVRPFAPEMKEGGPYKYEPPSHLSPEDKELYRKLHEALHGDQAATQTPPEGITSTPKGPIPIWKMKFSDLVKHIRPTKNGGYEIKHSKGVERFKNYQKAEAWLKNRHLAHQAKAISQGHVVPEEFLLPQSAKLSLCSPNPWEVYIGPHGRHGWRNVVTGRIKYARQRPGPECDYYA